MDTPPVMRNGRVFLPLRHAALAVGVSKDDIIWDPVRRVVTMLRENRVVQLHIGDRSMTVNGVVVPMDVAAVIERGRTLLPVRFVAHALNVDIAWDANARTVAIVTQRLPATAPAPATAPVVQRRAMSPQDVVTIVRPAVVQIETHRGRGSGFFVSADGQILTNAHVVRGSRQIVVTTHAGERVSATIEKIANWHDLALLRINASPNVRFPFLRDNPAAGGVQVGEEVLAFGSPLGLAGTVTRGIVSAWQTKDVTLRRWENNNIRVIQHDAAIAPGNSGGPLVNLYGEWVGVNTLVRTDWAGFGFAVPAERYHSLILRERYSVRCDWFSYNIEEFGWIEALTESNRLLAEAQAIQPVGSRARLERLSQYILVLQALRQEAATYQPLYPEVQNLHQLYLTYLDALIAVWTFARDSEINPLLWNRAHWDVLSNNKSHAWDAYISEWNAINARFR